jgi:TolB-like protein
MIWAGDTFVDFERGLNKAISRLRDALGDSAENPTFIETLARRGYRFIAPVGAKIRSLAVLPLENLSRDASQDYWADGITDELITTIARLANIRVIARASIMRFKSSALPLAEIAAELGVDAVVQGSLSVSDRRIRIRVQLIDPHTDQHLWVDSFDRELRDAVTLQQEIAQGISGHLLPHLAEERHTRVERQALPEAYESYLRGRFLWNKRTQEGIDKSFEYFNRAIILDPDFARAHAGLADSYVILGIFALLPSHDVCPKARVSAERALRLDDSLAEAHSSLAVVKNLYDWDRSGSECGFRRALELDPSCVVAHQWYAVLLTALRRHEEALAMVLRARELDPLSLLAHCMVAVTQMRAGQFAEAVNTCSKAIELDPDNPFGHLILARCLDARNQVHEALVESESAVKLSGNALPYAAHVGFAYARCGDQLRARSILQALQARTEMEYISPFHFALIHVALDEFDLAFEFLDRSLQERVMRMASGELFDPPFERLRPFGRFRDLINNLGLPALE